MTFALSCMRSWTHSGVISAQAEAVVWASLSLRQRPSRDCSPTVVWPLMDQDCAGRGDRPWLVGSRLEHAESPIGVPQTCFATPARWCAGDGQTHQGSGHAWPYLGLTCSTRSAATSDWSKGMAVMGRSYWLVAALNLTTSSAGTRPRSFTSMPWTLAHSRTSVEFRPLAEARRPLRAGRRVPSPTGPRLLEAGDKIGDVARREYGLPLPRGEVAQPGHVAAGREFGQIRLG
jgi:hypothetical protein